MTRQHVYFTYKILFLIGLALGSKSVQLENFHRISLLVARCIVYTTTLKILFNNNINKKAFDLKELFISNVLEYSSLLQILAIALSYLAYSKENLFDIYFLPITCADFVVDYFVMEQQSTPITYGVGMACSFFEGYLNHVIPSDGGELKGFQDNIRMFEDKNRVVFPVRRLFIIITKSLHCPPDLKSFNKQNRTGLPFLEACSSLEEIVKDVAGVKMRSYRNSTYRINRPGQPHHVYIAAECATPLHTLYKVLKNRDLYESLYHQGGLITDTSFARLAGIATINVKEVVADFTKTLKTIIANSPECKGKIELVYFDDEDESLNLSDTLLEKIKEIEPEYEKYLESQYNLLKLSSDQDGPNTKADSKSSAAVKENYSLTTPTTIK